MSTAVAEPEKKEQSPPAEYVMPTVRFGQQVAWYHGGDANGRPTLGTVEEVGSRTVTLVCISSGRGLFLKQSVRHISDPGFKANPNIRDDGVWDYTDYDKEQMSWRKRVEARLETRKGGKE